MPFKRNKPSSYINNFDTDRALIITIVGVIHLNIIFTKSNMLLVSGHKSDKGLLRENNEDSIYVNDKVGVYVLADGMGDTKAVRWQVTLQLTP